MHAEIKQLIEIVSLGQDEALVKFLSDLKFKDEKLPKKILNSFDGLGNIAVVIAAQRNDLQTLRWLYTFGADLSLADSSGCTALMWAKKYMNEEMIDLIKTSLDYENAKKPVPTAATPISMFLIPKDTSKMQGAGLSSNPDSSIFAPESKIKKNTNP